jgi:predicted NACHT family NTPase
MNDLFPGIAIANNFNKKLEKEIEKQFEQRNLTYSEYGVNKVLQIHETIRTRQAVMIVGGPMSGKSISLQLLSSALSLN